MYLIIPRLDVLLKAALIAIEALYLLQEVEMHQSYLEWPHVHPQDLPIPDQLELSVNTLHLVPLVHLTCPVKSLKFLIKFQ